jgi:hypothetical protein
MYMSQLNEVYIEMLSISLFIYNDFPLRSLFNWDISQNELKNPNGNNTKETILQIIAGLRSSIAFLYRRETIGIIKMLEFLNSAPSLIIWKSSEMACEYSSNTHLGI